MKSSEHVAWVGAGVWKRGVDEEDFISLGKQLSPVRRAFRGVEREVKNMQRTLVPVPGPGQEG